VVEKLVLMKQASDLHSPSINQMVMHRVAEAVFDGQVDKLIGAYRERRDGLLGALEANMPEGVSWSRPEGGMFVLLDVRGTGLGAADFALRQAMAPQANRPETKVTRYYARDQRSYTGPMKFNEFNTAPERATFPVLGFKGQPDVRAGKAPMSVGRTNEALRELEGVGVVASAYEPIEPKFNQFRAPV
jgi:hypothetical protein